MVSAKKAAVDGQKEVSSGGLSVGVGFEVAGGIPYRVALVVRLLSEFMKSLLEDGAELAGRTA